MDFLVIGLDRPDGGRRRQELRLAHLEYVAEKQDRLKYGGPLLDGDGRATGSGLILSSQDRAALEAQPGGSPSFRRTEERRVWEAWISSVGTGGSPETKKEKRVDR